MVATIANIDVVQAPLRLHGLCLLQIRFGMLESPAFVSIPFRSRTTMTSMSAIACNLEAGAGVRSRFSHGLGIDRAQCGTSAASACVLLCGVLRLYDEALQKLRGDHALQAHVCSLTAHGGRRLHYQSTRT